jgi:hypothetical protein
MPLRPITPEVQARIELWIRRMTLEQKRDTCLTDRFYVAT